MSFYSDEERYEYDTGWGIEEDMWTDNRIESINTMNDYLGQATELNLTHETDLQLENDLVDKFLNWLITKIKTREDLFYLAFSQPIKNDPVEELREIYQCGPIYPKLNTNSKVLTDNLYCKFPTSLPF